LTIHVHRRDAEEARAFCGSVEATASVFRAVELVGRDPAFIVGYAAADEAAKIFVEGVSRAVVLIEVFFELVAGGSAIRWLVGWKQSNRSEDAQISDLGEEFFGAGDELFGVGVEGRHFAGYPNLERWIADFEDELGEVGRDALSVH
jgi:hypothetical protein